MPDLRSRLGVDGHSVVVERIEVDLAVGIGRAAVDRSQHATPCAAGAVGGRNDRFMAPVVASKANSSFGYGPTTYIVPFTTMGAASWPRLTPNEKLHSS